MTAVPVRDLPGRAAALAAALGDDAPSGRTVDAMRRILAAGEHDVLAVADLIAVYRQEDDAAETARIARKAETRARTANVWESFVDQRSQGAVPPEGRRFIHLRDEVSGQLHRLAIPNEWLVY